MQEGQAGEGPRPLGKKESSRVYGERQVRPHPEALTLSVPSPEVRGDNGIQEISGII